MKHLIRIFLFNFFALFVTREIYPGLQIAGGLQMIVIAGGVFSLLMLIVKPLLKILFIPFNFLTFGLAGWFINVVVMYILTLVLPEVVIRPFHFPGLSCVVFMVQLSEFI